MKMDKKAFVVQSFKEAAAHHEFYEKLTNAEKRDLFFRLMQAAYGFVGSEWPKMDRNYYEVRTLLKNEKNDP
jgi:hypothetical protein